MHEVRRRTRYVSGLTHSGSAAGGDPSPWTALGVFQGMQAAVEARLDIASLREVRVAVQGLGKVGLDLCRLLHEAGAKLLVADVNAELVDLARRSLPVTVLPPDEIMFCNAQVLAPCALGGILNAETIPKLRVSVVAGAANNQLATPADGGRLAEQDILYAPDYVINAGGIISCAREYLGGSSADEVRVEVAAIRDRLASIFGEAAATGRATNDIADQLARRLVRGG